MTLVSRSLGNMHENAMAALTEPTAKLEYHKCTLIKNIIKWRSIPSYDGVLGISEQYGSICKQC